MARRIAAGIASGAAIAACFSTPPRPARDDGAVTDDTWLDDARRDSQGGSDGAGAMPPCTEETFVDPVPACGAWAVTGTSGAGHVGRSSTDLFLYMMGSGTGSASCRATGQAISSVTFAVKGALAGPAGDSTFVGFTAANGSAYGVQLKWEPSGSYVGMSASCPGGLQVSTATQWDSTAHRYLRVLRTASGSAEVLAGPSPSNFTVKISTCAASTQFDAAQVAAIAYQPGSGASGSGVIESVEFCAQ